MTKRYAHPLDIAEAVLMGPDRDDGGAATCRQCGETVSLAISLEPAPFCNPCAREALVTLAEYAQGKYIDNRLARLAQPEPPRRGKHRK